MKPTLFVLAAGMGSRYDAIRSGFGKVVFVIRKDFENDFREKILSKYENHIPVELVFQSINDVPEGVKVPAELVKPWGTNHAVLMGKGVIKEPFATINADDFYGRESFEVLAKELSSLAEGSKNQYCMVGYRVGNTLSESGTVSRGICETNEEGLLTSVVERTQIGWNADHKVYYVDENGADQVISENTPVSMNMWGFTPEYFDYSEEYFINFAKANEGNLKAEFYIPLLVNDLVNSGTAKLKVLDTPAKWFGVTYAADRQGVVDKIAALVAAGEYPEKLFK